jgi:hypothetical protein
MKNINLEENIECFLKTMYVVCWAGCTIPLSGRSFEDYDAALKLYRAGQGEPSLRIERLRGLFILDTVL